MSVKSILPTSNLYDYDIMDTLNANGGSVSSWEGMFKAAAKINPWSKHKPVKLNDTFVQDFDSSKPHYKKDWWKGSDGLCGFDLSSAKTSGFATLVGLYNNGTNGWDYVPVYGKGILRQNDFAQYYPAAERLVRAFNAPEQIFQTSKGTAYITIPASNIYTLGWSDFPALKDYYFGILLYRSSSDWQRVTSSTTIGNGGLSVEFDPAKLTVNKYTIYPFISKNKYTSQAQEATSGDVIYTLPNIKATEITIKSVSSALTILVVTSRDVANKAIVWSVSVTNNTNSSVQINNNSLKFQDVGYELTEGSVNQTQVNLSNALIPANASSYIIGSGTTRLPWAANNSNFATMDLWVHAILNSGTYDNIISIPQSIDIGDKVNE